MSKLVQPISVVIPAYNEEKLIMDCIGSVHDELQDWGVPYEIIVVDNGSTDLTVAIAKELGCKIVECSEKGVTRARQAGLEAASNEIIAFIDADNVIPPGWFIYGYVKLLAPKVVAVSGPVRYFGFGRTKQLITWAFYKVGRATHRFFPMLQGGNFILKKSALLKAGGFNTDVDFYGEDTSTAMRLSEVGHVAFEGEMFCYSSPRRMQEEGMLRTGLRYALNYIWMHLRDKPFTDAYKDIRQ